MARTISIQITLDEDVKKSAEAVLKKIGMDIGSFFVWSLKNVATPSAVQKALVDETAGSAADEHHGEATNALNEGGIVAKSDWAQHEKMTKKTRIAAWKEFKEKYQGIVKADICYKTELEKARDEKYADFI